MSSRPALSAKFKGTFAYKTVKDRMPVILTKAIDYLYRERNIIRDQYREESQDDLKTVIANLSCLRSKMQTNKPLKSINSVANDTQLWNDYLEEVTKNEGQPPTWFNSAWLYVECYMYRKIHEAFELSTFLKGLDPFAHQKQSAFQSAVYSMEVLGSHLFEILDNSKDNSDSYHEFFIKLCEVSLWGNKNDLSISAGDVKGHSQDILEQANSFRDKIIVNNIEEVWKLVRQKPNGSLGYILDNTGLELFADLCLADFLLEIQSFSEIHFYVKAFPWFVSDVTKIDFEWTLQQLETSDNKHLANLSKRWRSHLENGKFKIMEEKFFTIPFAFNEMKQRDETLYSKLSLHKLLIFKGDLNYRKLGADLQWPHEEKFSSFLQGFCPAPLVVLRTLKAEIVVGLESGQAEKLRRESEDWLTSGDFAVVQFNEKL